MLITDSLQFAMSYRQTPSITTHHVYIRNTSSDFRIQYLMDTIVKCLNLVADCTTHPLGVFKSAFPNTSGNVVTAKVRASTFAKHKHKTDSRIPNRTGLASFE